MKLSFSKIITCTLLLFFNLSVTAQEAPPSKTNIDITIDDLGAAVCVYSTKYDAFAWDNFLRTVGNNTSLIKNNLIRTFPKYVLSDFKYDQNTDDRTNKITFKIDGFMMVNNNGKWMADLEGKNPDITKLTDTDFLLVTEGVSMKLHVPPGTEGAKVEKDSFGKAFLTFPAKDMGGGGGIFMYLGLGVAALGGFLLYRNMSGKARLKTIYEPITPHAEIRQKQPTAAIIAPSSTSAMDEPVEQPSRAVPQNPLSPEHDIR